jgi:hypothetical protein
MALEKVRWLFGTVVTESWNPILWLDDLKFDRINKTTDEVIDEPLTVDGLHEERSSKADTSSAYNIFLELIDVSN